jgi:DNA polymerase-1
MPSKKTEALIDGDILIHRISAAVEVPWQWDDDIWTLHSDARMAKHLLDVEIASIREKLGGKSVKVLICLSSPNNWRNTLLTTYKSNRKGNRKPIVYKDLRAYVANTYDVAVMPTLEADDVMGIMATDPKRKNRVIVTIDKDLRTVPGVHFNPDHDTHPRVIAENEANYAHMMQTLCGDSTDGYSGCPGVGPKKAEAILANGHTWDLVLDAFRKAGLSEDEALVQARVARILRHHEFNQRTSEVKLWTPATSS